MMNEKTYRMKDLGVECLIDRVIISAVINVERNLVILNTTQGMLFLTWEGDCCSKCFLAHVSGSEALINNQILSAQNTEWVKLKEDESEVIESMGTTIKTTIGTVTFETRLEHNGYYGGHIMVSDDEPIDQYHSPRDGWEKDAIRPLEDF